MLCYLKLVLDMLAAIQKLYETPPFLFSTYSKAVRSSHSETMKPQNCHDCWPDPHDIIAVQVVNRDLSNQHSCSSVDVVYIWNVRCYLRYIIAIPDSQAAFRVPTLLTLQFIEYSSILQWIERE